MKNKYLTIFESLHSPVAVLTRENRIDTCNHAWKVLFGSTTPPGSDSYADKSPPPTNLADHGNQTFRCQRKG